ncbi:MAG TPA: SRPBCC family protein [Solimonas sp.]|nr:SRPBCC family protein [Solimonas sp.]
MIRYMLVAVLSSIVALLLFAATRPDSFRVERSTLVQAPPAAIQPLIEDFHRWTAWSPWEHRDPAMKRTYSGAERGIGAAYAWEGNSEVGSGRMEILESTPQKIVIKLDFITPFEGHNTAEFTLVPEGNSTRVGWAMFGPANYLSKVMGLLFNMDKMIGKDFEAGLASLKTAAETQK